MNIPFSIRRAKFCLLFVLTACSAQAGTLTVNSTGDAGGTCPGTSCTLRQAIAAALPGDTIAFSLPPNSAVSLTSAGLLVNKDLTIIGPGADLLTVQRDASAGSDFGIFQVADTFKVSISGLTIANGKSVYGAGILNYGTLTITNTTVSGNSGLIGGGIYNSNGTLTVTNSTISGNSTTNTGYFGGGGIFNVGPLTIAGTTVSGNTATTEGGGIYNYKATATITDSTISGNSAGTYGGGISNNGGSTNAENTIIAKNTASAGPDFYGSLTAQGYNLIGNDSGAVIFSTTGDQIGNNAAPIDPMLGPLQDNGGPTKTQALLYGSPAIDKGKYAGSSQDQRGYARPVDLSTVTNASGGDGNDIGAYEVQPNDQPAGCNAANPVVSNTNDAGTGSLRDVIGTVCAGSTISFASNVRGAIKLTSGELLVNKSLTINGPGANLLSVQRSASASTSFRIFNIADHLNVAISGLTIANGNRAGNLGGGIYNSSALTLANVTVSGNTADIGAGIYTARTATISNSTISGNIVSGNNVGDGGGAIYNQGNLKLVNSTLSGNIAHLTGGGGQGGGIRNNNGNVTISSTTVAANSADQAGGIYSDGGSITFENSIIAQNTSADGPDLHGTFTSNGFNLVGNNSAATIAVRATDQIGTPGSLIDPLIGPLQDNGGPSFTHALGSGSPALDKGNSSGLKIDQRGLPRPSDDPSIANVSGGDGSDIGAFEFQVPAPTPTPTPTPASQLLNLSTRKEVGAGDNVLIGGFIVVGTEDKKVLLRGLGPSLPVAGALADPTLELHASDTTLLAFDDNWRDKQPDEINATGIPPTNELESATVTSLAAKPAANGGAGYTAILAGSGGGTGIGLLEIYDLAQAANAKLANISTRGFVGTGDDLLIGGFIPGPSDRAPLKVLVRALGPSLTAQGVNGALQDPLLELHDANGTLVTNDNWRDASDASEIQATLPPPDDREAAIITTLAPSNAGYTAVVRGAAGATGVALVEVYALQ
jgi:CSLREA domain-containing protein